MYKELHQGQEVYIISSLSQTIEKVFIKEIVSQGDIQIKGMFGSSTIPRKMDKDGLYLTLEEAQIIAPIKWERNRLKRLERAQDRLLNLKAHIKELEEASYEEKVREY